MGVRDALCNAGSLASEKLPVDLFVPAGTLEKSPPLERLPLPSSHISVSRMALAAGSFPRTVTGTGG